MLSAGFHKGPPLLLDQRVDPLVEAPVGQHEVSGDVRVIDSRKQVERHLRRTRGEDLREL